jgi:hypothetical protein
VAEERGGQLHRHGESQPHQETELG